MKAEGLKHAYNYVLVLFLMFISVINTTGFDTVLCYIVSFIIMCMLSIAVLCVCISADGIEDGHVRLLINEKHAHNIVCLFALTTCLSAFMVTDAGSYTVLKWSASYLAANIIAHVILTIAAQTEQKKKMIPVMYAICALSGIFAGLMGYVDMSAAF